MNQRIQKLAEQAGFMEAWFSESGDFCGHEIKKFAELIVRECARVYWNIDDGEIHGEYVKALKEHFGVEE